MFSPIVEKKSLHHSLHSNKILIDILFLFIVACIIVIIITKLIVV